MFLIWEVSVCGPMSHDSTDEDEEGEEGEEDKDSHVVEGFVSKTAQCYK